MENNEVRVVIEMVKKLEMLDIWLVMFILFYIYVLICRSKLVWFILFFILRILFILSKVFVLFILII